MIDGVAISLRLLRLGTQEQRTRDVLYVQHFAGVVRTNDAVQIEILPKISKTTDTTEARRLFVRMLSTTENPPFNLGTFAQLSAQNLPLFEILIRQFLEYVGDIVRKGIARNYVPYQGELLFLRGKLCVSQQIKRNFGNKARFCCEFDEFEKDRPINRLIKRVLEIIGLLTQNGENQQRCREMLFWFESVPASQNPMSDFGSMRLDRLAQHYQPALPICRLILENMNPLTQAGEYGVISLLYPMSQIFESYVSSKLQRQFPHWRVRSHIRGQSLIENHRGRAKFGLIPDLELHRSDEIVIAETKWKLLNQLNPRNNYGISQSDAYQLFAYLQKYLPTQTHKRVFLVYPKTDVFDSALPPFWFRERTEALYVVSFDLDTDKVVLDDQAGLSL